jgi:hypothetical protein
MQQIPTSALVFKFENENENANSTYAMIVETILSDEETEAYLKSAGYEIVNTNKFKEQE